MKIPNPINHLRIALQRCVLASALGAGLGVTSTQAETTIHVGGQNTIGDSTLTTTAGVATLPNAGGYWAAAGGVGVVYSNLTSPTLTVPVSGTVTLKFKHRYYLEGAYDGGAVYLSVNGGTPTYLAASAFSVNGYNATLTGSSVFTGMDVFNGQSTGWATPNQLESSATLGTFVAGDTIAVTFRGGWDEGVFEADPNWEIGTVEVRDAANTALLNVDFLAGMSGFKVTSDTGLADPWRYRGTTVNQFELDATTLTADRYVPDPAGSIIDLSDANLAAVVLNGTLSEGNSFSLFDLTGGATLQGYYSSITLPPGMWDVSGLRPGGNGKITAGPPPLSALLFSTNTDSLPADGENTGPWAQALPSGGPAFPNIGVPKVQAIDGVKWVRNYRDDSAEGNGNTGFRARDLSANPVIPCFGVTIVAAVKPIYCTPGGEPRGEIVDIFYDRLALAVDHADGRIMVCRNYWNDYGPAIPDGTAVILSLVVQPNGSYVVYSNGVQVMTGAANGDFSTQMIPTGSQDFKKYVNIGRNDPDGWSAFNGNIGDVLVYTCALPAADRQTIEAGLTEKFLGVHDAYSTWIGSPAFNTPPLSPAQKMPGADPDGDGLTNQQEFAFGLNPVLGSSVNPITAPLDKSNHKFNYTRYAASGLTYTVWTSTDLQAWNLVLPGDMTENAGTPNGAGVATVEVTLTNPPVGNKLFVRVQAE
jgi:hypothetical protein